MKRDLKNKLLLFSFMLSLSLNVQSAHEVNGTSEGNITVDFTFQNSAINSFKTDKITSLYKNGVKKRSCKQTNPSCSERFVLGDVENHTVTLHITNVSLEDKGTYYVAVLAGGENPLIESNKIQITVKLGNTKTTETTYLPENVEMTTPEPKKLEQRSFLIFLIASFIIFICLFVGILYWFYRTYPRKTDVENPPVQNNTTTQQGRCGRSEAVFVSCVEYGELDFQNRPERDDRVKPAEATSKAQDGVEYAAIIFPQQKQAPSGRMRNKQQVPAIKR
ncbi:CMRF35-like molecule 8 [Pseudorasbora parva]|uniref:CMRF35-like molecule 8 n=1 Tax=Pseudorasbora parva TaxID=51549 RepID=UPI00351F6A59